jgi:FMN phosphatase YigB (HAD superfamily)
MIIDALEHAHMDELVDAIFDVVHVKKYKPATEAYEGLLTSLEHLEFGREPEKCWLVSA